MSYVPNRIVTVAHDKLSESFDLTKPTSTFVGREAYLVVKQKETFHVLSIGLMVSTLSKLDLTKPVGELFTPLFDDLFVTRFEVFTIPIQNKNGLYPKNIKVFNPVSYKDYKVRFTSVKTPHIRDDVTKKGFLDDLAIVSIHDMSQCLVAVNGVFHRTAYTDGVLYVIDGFRTIRLSGRKDVTIVDTKDIGGHTIIPLTASNVKQSGYQESTIVTLNQSIAKKSVFAVIDGYFYHRDTNVVTAIDNKNLSLRVNKLPLIQQFRHNPRTLSRVDRFGEGAGQGSRQYTDVYESVFLNARTTTAATLRNKNFQYSRLTAFHSFLVVMNNPNLFSIVSDITPTGTPQLYTEPSLRPVSGMLEYGCGLCPSYLVWKDPSQRKTILLPEQDYDVDWQDQVVGSDIIPSLITDSTRGSRASARFIDYVAA